MTKTEMQSRIRVLREELENRHRFGVTKLAQKNSEPISVEALQSELYSLIYKVSKIE